MRVKRDRSWSVVGTVLTLEDWRKNFRSSKVIISKVVVRVRLPDLPFDYWDRDSILEIDAMVGKPIAVDGCTNSSG